MAYNPADPYGANNSGANPYDGLRKRAVDDAQAAGQSGMDAITRRYAAMGNLNSGSYIKSQEDAARGQQQQQENALGSINAQEVQNSLPFQQQQMQQNFAKEMQQGQFGQQSAMQQAQLGQQASQFQQELPLKQKQLDLEASQQALDSQANQVNAGLAGQQLSRTGGLFGGGGFLGTGIGGGK